MSHPLPASPADKLALGTSRLGVPAGAGPRPGPPADELARALLQAARESRLALVDTAPTESERLLGQAWPFPSPFRVIAKTLPLAEGLDRVEARARRSLERMGLPRGEALLVSSAADLVGAEGRALWARLEKLKADGFYRRIGFCARMEDGPALIARRFTPDIVQIPCSLLDQRPVREGVLDSLAEQGIEIHLRSVFLKGLLFAPHDRLAAAAPGAGQPLSRIRRTLAEAGVDPMQAALGFALGRPEAAAVIVGASSAAELRAVVAAACAPQPDLDWSALALDDPAVLSDARRVSSAA